MDVEKIFSLIDKAESSSFDRIEIQIQDVRLCLERNRFQAPAAEAAMAAGETAAAAQETDTDGILFAPISGVFYAAREPGAEPYVREGQRVHRGEPVCVVEAMKMMNEICAPRSGVIERVYAQNAQPVTEGDALFLFAKEA
jgi:Biotin carboxyl carrier protein